MNSQEFSWFTLGFILPKDQATKCHRISPQNSPEKSGPSSSQWAVHRCCFCFCSELLLLLLRKERKTKQKGTAAGRDGGTVSWFGSAQGGWWSSSEAKKKRKKKREEQEGRRKSTGKREAVSKKVNSLMANINFGPRNFKTSIFFLKKNYLDNNYQPPNAQ